MDRTKVQGILTCAEDREHQFALSPFVLCLYIDAIDKSGHMRDVGCLEKRFQDQLIVHFDVDGNVVVDPFEGFENVDFNFKINTFFSFDIVCN